MFRKRWDELLTLLGKNHAHIGVSLLFTELGRLRMGYDALDVDVGTYDSWYRAHPPMNFDKGVYLPFAEQVKQVEGVPALAEGDTVITAVGMEANHTLFDAIRDDYETVLALGDGRRVRNIFGAIWDGYEAARSL